MGSNIPPKPSVEQIIWFETHLPLWAASPTAFGTTAAAVTAQTTLVVNARKAYNDAQNARQMSKNATEGETAAVNNMLFGGRAMVNTMKAFIEQSHNETLWGQSGLSPSAPPGPAPDPVAPYTMTASLDVDGNVILNWKTRQPVGLSGVSYSVRRALNEGEFVLLDTVGGKTFTDMGVPVGTQSVSYTIKARHGEQTSAWSPSFTVRFGRAGGGGLAIVSTESAGGPMKMAA